jgi:hypothetical protein
VATTKYGSCHYCKETDLYINFGDGRIKVIIFDDNDSLRDSVAMLLRETEDFTLAGSYSNCINVIEKYK